MKRVGILNFPGHMNQGANLTAYALQKTICDMGYDAKNLWLQCNNSVVKDAKYTDFSDQYIKITPKPAYGHLGMQRYNDDFDTFIVGSDQVWRYEKSPVFSWKTKFEKCFQLAFAEPGKRRIAVAASFGTSTYDADEKTCQAFGKELQRYSAISVREKSGVSLVEQLAHKTPTLLIDPVFYLEPSVWHQIATPPHHPSEHKIVYNSFFYTPFIKELQKELGNTYTFENALNGNTSQWLASIRDAQFVITDSFHVCCFCLIFNTPFACIAEKRFGIERFYELSRTFGFSQDRVIDMQNTEDKIATIKHLMSRQLETEAINTAAADGRKKALNWLKEALETPIPEWNGSIPKRAGYLACMIEKYTNNQWKNRQKTKLKYFIILVLFYLCPFQRSWIRRKHTSFKGLFSNFSW